MIHYGVLVVFFVLCRCAFPCHAGNILFVTLYGSRSHVLTITPAMESLSSRGHNVTYLTFMAPNFERENNVTVLPLKEVETFIAANRFNFFDIMNHDYLLVFKLVSRISEGVCGAAMKDPNFKLVAENSSTRFDLIIADPSFSECALPLVQLHNNIPLIFYCTTNLYSWTAFSLDIPSPFAYVPLYFTRFIDEMTFSQRYMNVISSLLFIYYRNHYLIPNAEKIIRDNYPAATPLLDIEKNASFVFANSFSPALDFSRPMAPFFAEVGGAHCRPAKSLPKHIEDFIAGDGGHGFIYFSVGTYVRGSDMHPDKLNSFIEAFRKLKQRVIWKFEVDLPNLPSNVRVFRWVPQQDLLGHPKIKVFLTQGGQLSVQEAVYHSVPVLGIPVFEEHIATLTNLRKKKIAEMLNYKDLTADAIYGSLIQIINDTSYRDNCEVYSRLFRDRSMEAIDTINYWVEYIIRHNGGSHLRFNTNHLNFFQYFLLDVIGFVLLAIAISCYLLAKGYRFVSRLFTNKELNPKTTTQTNNHKKLS